MLAEKNEAIREASAHLHILTEDEKIRLQCEGREMYEHDIATIRGEGRDEGFSQGITQGISQGISKGQQRINHLNLHLIQENRFDELKRSASDPAYQEQLMKEYGIL